MAQGCGEVQRGIGLVGEVGVLQDAGRVGDEAGY